MNWVQKHAVSDPEALAQPNVQQQGDHFYDTAEKVSKALGMSGDCTLFAADKKDPDKTDEASVPGTSMKSGEAGKE